MVKRRSKARKTKVVYRTRKTNNPFGQMTNLAVSGAGAIMTMGIANSMASAFSK